MDPFALIIVIAVGVGLAASRRALWSPRKVPTTPKVSFERLARGLELHQKGAHLATGVRGGRRISLRRFTRRHSGQHRLEVWLSVHLEQSLEIGLPSIAAAAEDLGGGELGRVIKASASRLSSDPELGRALAAAYVPPFYIAFLDNAVCAVSGALPHDVEHAWEVFEALEPLARAAIAARRRVEMPVRDDIAQRLESAARPNMLRAESSPPRAVGRHLGFDVELTLEPGIGESATAWRVAVALAQPLDAFAALERQRELGCAVDYDECDVEALGSWSARAWGASLPPVLERPGVRGALGALPQSVRCVRLAGDRVVVVGDEDVVPAELLRSAVTLARSILAVSAPGGVYR